MESERKIEKLLRAFAKKRRDEAGKSFDLHPATRRLLQSEVARHRAPKPQESGGSFLSFFSRMRPSRVFAVCFVASLIISAALIVPSLGIAKKKSIATGRYEASNVDGPTTLAKSTGSQLPPTLPASGSLTVTNALLWADGRAQPKERLRDGTSEQPVAEPGRVLEQLGSMAEKSKSEEAATNALAIANVDRQKLETDAALQLRRLASETPGSPGATSVAFASSPAPASLDKDAHFDASSNFSATQRYRQDGFAMNFQNRFKNNITTKVAPVLANFEVQQNGSTVAVVDEDGSVYNGVVVANDALSENASALAQTRAASPKILEQSAPQKKAADMNESAQNYSFRVSGVNRSLKQFVVFTGNVVSDSNAPPQQNFGGATVQKSNVNQLKQMLKNSAQQSLFSNSRIAGTALVGSTNLIEINAVPLQ